jgi:hypothetical protein
MVACQVQFCKGIYCIIYAFVMHFVSSAELSLPLDSVKKKKESVGACQSAHAAGSTRAVRTALDDSEAFHVEP